MGKAAADELPPRAVEGDFRPGTRRDAVDDLAVTLARAEPHSSAGPRLRDPRAWTGSRLIRLTVKIAILAAILLPAERSRGRMLWVFDSVTGRGPRYARDWVGAADAEAEAP